MTKTESGLSRKLGLFDATMIVMGGIIGSGIFMNPHVVAEYLHSPLLIIGAWVAGGVIAILGAFIYAELAARRPEVGGQYAYFREAYHPLIAFLFGWSLLLISNCGGMAAVAMTFGRYFIEVTAIPVPDTVVAIVTLVILTLVNCMGVRTGGTVQNILMIIKIFAVIVLVVCGYAFIHPLKDPVTVQHETPGLFALVTSFGAALVPVMFAYGGWQTANFIAGEIVEPRKNLPRGLLLGVTGVIILYMSVNFICVRALGVEGLARTTTPASEVMSLAFGNAGAKFIAVGIAISTLGFLSQSILTAPRVYFAMAQDGLFFRGVSWIHPKTRVPVVAIALEGLLSIAVILWGSYEQILSYVVSDDFIFFGLTASTIFIFRKKSTNTEAKESKFNMPGHPYTTILFILVAVFIVINTIYKYPINTLIGIGIILTGIPVFLIWNRRSQSHATTPSL